MQRLAGWSGTWKAFFDTEQDTFLHQLWSFHASLPWIKELPDSQLKAWKIEYQLVKNTLQSVCESAGFAPNKAWIAFEQELVGEGGKRAADVNLVLPTGDLWVLEFKHKKQASEQEIWRALFDLKTLQRFHSESINLRGHCFLALTKPGAQPFHCERVAWDRPDNKGVLPRVLAALLSALAQPQDQYNVLQWQHGHFYRQPSILHGTVQVFFEQNLPTLKTSAGENLEQARQSLLKLYRHAQEQQKRYLVVVHGRPGAGKTLLGISAVADLVNTWGADHCKPVFLSGNGPLVQVLQHTLTYYGQLANKEQLLDGRVMIENLVNFKHTLMSQNRCNELDENFVVFDEAQRAWEKVNSHKEDSESELHLFCDWLAKKQFGVLVLLVGDGQAIYNNEMSLQKMLQTLEEALKRHGKRICTLMPQLHAQHFKKIPVFQREVFNLNTPLRQAYTEDLDQWIEAVLKGDAAQARQVAESLSLDYPLFLTPSKQAADDFARALKDTLHTNNRKADAFRMGWLVSSKGGPFINSITAKDLNLLGPWYVEPDSPTSCCKLQAACTEFTSQGLELSLALLNWGQDLQYRNGELKPSRDHQFQRTQEHYTLGSYRVLLSRGRNGLIIKCDDVETFQFLQACGMRLL